MRYPLNVSYTLDGTEGDRSLFKMFWLVNADSTYRVRKPRGFPYPSMFITFSGKGCIHKENTAGDIPLMPNSVIITESHTPYTYRCDGSAWGFHFYMFRDEGLVRELGMSKDTVMYVGSERMLREQGEQIMQEILYKPVGYTHRVDNLLREILIRCARQAENVPGKTSHAGINTVCGWMVSNLNKSLRSTELARMAGMNRTTFFKAFQRATGETPTNYFNQLKLRSAALTLESTATPIKDIAENLGFCDPYYFSKLFKKYYGVSPRKFRITQTYSRSPL